MKKIFFLLLAIIGLLLSCEKTPNTTKENCYSDYPPRNSDKVTISQGLWGDVWFWSGNFMPISFGEICQIKRKMLIYELTTMDDVVQLGDSPFYTEINTKLIAAIYSDEYGFFQIELEPGEYSLFVEENHMYYANRFSSEGIYRVSIEAGQVSDVTFDITYEASF